MNHLGCATKDKTDIDAKLVTDIDEYLRLAAACSNGQKTEGTHCAVGVEHEGASSISPFIQIERHVVWLRGELVARESLRRKKCLRRI